MMTINETLTLENQLEKIGALQHQGYRFVTMTVVDKGEEFDIFYHFDLEYELHSCKLELKKEIPCPVFQVSVSPPSWWKMKYRIFSVSQ